MESKLLGPDGKPIPRSLCVEYDGRVYPYRVVSGDQLQAADPRVGLLGVLCQMGDQNNIAWLALLALAKDLYSRHPEGSREFQKLAEQIGLTIVDGHRNEIVVAEELRKV